MGRVTLPDHENMSTRSPLRVRGTPAQRQVWQEVGAECGMTETAFARASLLILLKAISQHEPSICSPAPMTAPTSAPPVSTPSRRWLMVNRSSVAIWELYELKKRELQAMGLSQREYELAVRRLADELEV